MSQRADAAGLLVAEEVTRRFDSPSGPVVALDRVSATIDAGRLTVVAGRSGSGKSTLLAMFAAVDRPDEGEVYVDGHPIGRRSRRDRRRWRRERLGMVLPQPSDNLSERFDAVGNLRWARSLRGAPADPAEDVALLARFGLTEVETAALHELSMGQQMRLGFACAIAGSPQLVVADEPTASLDAEAGATLVDALTALAATGMTLIVATHDPALVEAADVAIWLEDGRRVT